MKQTYNITFKSQLFIVRDMLIYAMVMFLFYRFYVRIFDPSFTSELARVLVAVYVLTFVIPCLVIHLQYLRFNRDVSLSVDMNQKKLEIIRANKTITITTDQIRRVTIVRAPIWGRLYGWEGTGLLASDRYRYAEVVLHDGSRFVLTCLLIFDLAKFFRGFDLWPTERRVVFPWVSAIPPLHDDEGHGDPRQEWVT